MRIPDRRRWRVSIPHQSPSCLDAWEEETGSWRAPMEDYSLLKKRRRKKEEKFTKTQNEEREIITYTSKNRKNSKIRAVTLSV